VNLLNRKIRLYLLSVTVLGLGLYALLDLTGWQRLQAVTLDGIELKDWSRRLELDTAGRTLEQPLEEIAARLLKDKKTAQVSIKYALPDRLQIETNRFDPICFVLDKQSGRLFGMDGLGRSVPLNSSPSDWERPVITGTWSKRLFELCEDPRAALISPQLVRLADENAELFRLVDEIDLSSPQYAVVTLAGLRYQLRVNADRFYDEMIGYIDFLQKYRPEMAETKLLDMRFANMVIQRAARK
jgi:hypothetical protein